MPCHKCYIYASFVDLAPVLANPISKNTVLDKIQCNRISSLINLSWLATKKLRSVYHTVHNKCSTCSSLHTDLKYKGNNFCRLIGTKKITGRCRAECTRGAFNKCQQKYYTIHRLYTYYHYNGCILIENFI